MLKKFVSLLILVLVALGAFYVYRTHENVKRVLSYEPAVKKSLQEQGLGNDTRLALAIIYTETKGKDVDVMQSSESLNGKANDIGNESESITQGVSNLAKVLEYASEKKVDVWTGVQAYNYGKSYVDYVVAHGGKNTLALSKKYSRMVVAPSLGNTTGETYYHLTVDSLMYNQGKLYVNGGNIFYAKEVQYHMYLMDLFDW
ncbi:lysozyme family protein [Lactococcus nasutitermitis]|uniref:Lysozyme family protein n=1 Tax=Lactococcus nasutitermitis TaxID=1652957 RepID=A0ABV9J9Q5_9LACT|nr:lysozyme family protein [Lactococcus nasutitermitis]